MNQETNQDCDTNKIVNDCVKNETVNELIINFTKPGTYKVTALVIYGGNAYSSSHTVNVESM